MTIRIAMWSGPRNLSTALMRSFENRPDCAVSDEPFYAAYLAATGLDHPMREKVLASLSTDWDTVAAQLTGPSPDGAPIWYQKHMTHHMLPNVNLEWARGFRHAFLIRSPEQVLQSYVEKRQSVSLEDIGFVRQAELFRNVSQNEGVAPPVLDSDDLLDAPQAILRQLCDAIGIPFTDAMLSWPSGPRESDGIWAPAWYNSVEKTTGFARQRKARNTDLPDHLRRIADAARPYYEKLAAGKLSAS